MKRALTKHRLSQENKHFTGTAGVSENNRTSGFLPAFRDITTGRVYLSRFADGRRAPVHLIEGLPPEIVARRTATGEVQTIKRSVVSGFVLDGRFHTRAMAARSPAICH